jgi:hypothetical protein
MTSAYGSTVEGDTVTEVRRQPRNREPRVDLQDEYLALVRRDSEG